MEANLSAQTIGDAGQSVKMPKGLLSALMHEESGLEEAGIEFSDLIEMEQLAGAQLLAELMQGTLSTQPQEVTTELLTLDGKTEGEGKTEAEDKTEGLQHLVVVEQSLAALLDEEGEVVAEGKAAGQTPKQAAMPAATTQAVPAPLEEVGVESNQGARRQQLGQPVLEEKFPAGWEVLLDDESPQPVKETGKNGPAHAGKATAPANVNDAGKIEVPELKTEWSKDQGEVKQHLNAKEGAPKHTAHSLQADGVQVQPKAAQLEMDTMLPAASELSSRTGEEKISPTAANQHANAMSDITLGTEYHSAGPVNKSAAATAAQTLMKMTELQKGLTIRDFSQKLVHGIRGKEDRLVVELHPPDLGKIKVVVESHGNHVNTHLSLQDRNVAEFFQARSDLIRKSLEEAGIQLGNLSVEVKQEFSPPAKEESTAHSGQRSIAGAGAEKSEQLAGRSETKRSTVAGAGKVDMLI